MWFIAMRFLCISIFAAIVSSQALISTDWLGDSLPQTEGLPYDVAYDPSVGTRCTVDPVEMLRFFSTLHANLCE
jgi:hypothetical protein